MVTKAHNPTDLFPQYGNYHHAIEVENEARLLFISGLNGFEKDGKTIPSDFDGQARMIWTHIGSILSSADMTYRNIVSLRIYLASAEYDEANMAIRKEFLGEHRTSLTVVCCQLLESAWKLEIEAVAAAP